MLKEVARCHDLGEPLDIEYRIRRRDGRVVWWRDRAEIIRDEGGKPQYLLGVNSDITDYKRAEEMLRESQVKLEKRVKERTAELVAANRRLRIRNA